MKDTKMNFWAATKFIYRFMRDMKLQYFLFYVGWLFHTVVVVITPIIFGVMINQIVYYNNIEKFVQVGMVFLYVTLFGVVLYYLIYEMYADVWNGINGNLRRSMFRHLQRLTAEELVHLDHGETVGMIKYWTMECVNFVVRNIVHNINNVLKIFACIFIIFRISPIFGGITIVLVPLSVAVSLKIGKKIRENSDKNRDEYGSYLSWLFEIVHGLSDIKLMGAEEKVYEKLDKKLTGINGWKQKIAEENALGNELLVNIKNVILIFQYGLLAYFAIHENLTIGTIMVLLTFFNTLSDSLSQVAKSYMDAQYRISIVQKIKDFFDKETMVQEGKNGECVYDRIQRIEFVDCDFSYGESKVLKNVSFTVERGEKVAIVGASGSGKTTLLNMLLGFCSPQKGQVLVNGKALEDYSTESYYEHVSAMFQQVILLEGSLYDNLCMGEEISENRLKEACQAAAIYEEIMGWQDGFYTRVEIGGTNFSGGQKQRMGIARAYLRNSDLVVMDEATSALDSENEEQIIAGWDQILEGRMCIMVSHRLNTVLHADKIIMLKDGEVCKIGTPEEFMENNREFKELFAV